MGPGLERRMPSAAIARTGVSSSSADAASTTSTRRLITANDPPDGHEYFSRIEADLVAPSSRAVLKRLQRARVWVGSHLALIAGHSLQLERKGRRDIDPGVRHEGPRVSPFRTAGRLKSIDSKDVALSRTRGH